MCSKITLTLIAIVLIVGTLSAATTNDKEPVNTSTLIVDNSKFINANQVFMFVTNHGNWGRDVGIVFGLDYGTWYPFPVGQDPDIIWTSEVGFWSPQYAAGLWLGGYVDGELRVTVAEYNDEYVPGPMAGGTFIEDNPGFKVFKLYSDSLEGNPNDDYLNWPVGQGAPVDGLGQPIMMGNQMLWSVYNDADPDAHINNAGETAPLGIEVQQTSWAFDNANALGSTVILRYKLYNRGDNEIDDFYISIWMDADVGQANDDLVGCDTLRNMFYAYNADNDDGQYDSNPPATGYTVLKGPVVPSEGDIALFDRYLLPGYKNIDLTAVAAYLGGVDPDGATETYNLMRGLNMDGSPLANGTPYAYPGDPVAGTGDLDPFGADKRIMGSFGPFDFNPGDSQYVLIAYSVAQANDRLNAVTALKSYRSVYDSYVAELESNAIYSAFDHETFIDANDILMFVTNYGVFGRDLGHIFGYMIGTWWPYPGDTSYISQNIDGAAWRSPLFESGLWLGGIDSVTGETRMAVGEFSSEYQPGPMQFYTFAPMDPSFHVYKLYNDSLAENPNSDYTNWPFALGAPMDEFGDPDMMGTQMLWSVYNDANPATHTNDAGSTLPLGIEVQQTTWAFADVEDEESSLYIRYKLYNKGENVIKDMYLGHWSDPDLGNGGDDLIGCDTLNDIWYCYNADNDDGAYGSPPPAVGFKLLAGPVVPMDGHTANFDNHWLDEHENLGMTSFMHIIQGGVTSYEQGYGYLQGLYEGLIPYVYDDEILSYMFSGDPVTGDGDVDIAPYDRRMIAVSGPFDFRPGDSQFVLIKMAVAQGTTNLSSIDEVRTLLTNGFNPYIEVLPPPPPLPSTYSVSQNYPNPFNPKTTIEYRLSNSARVTIDIYNVLGQKIRRLVDRVQPAGVYLVDWDGTDGNDQVVATGLYFYHFKAGDLQETKKMVLLK